MIWFSVVDQNDHTPTFSQDVYTVSIAENSPPGQVLLRLHAMDLDVGLNAAVVYQLQDVDPDGLLNIDSLIGVVSNTQELDYEVRRMVTATVVAVDGGMPPRSSSAAIVIKVINVDDERLQFSRSNYSFTVAEYQPAGTPIGHVTAYDLDLDPAQRRVSYRLELTQDSRVFYVVEETGAILTNASLDSELQRLYRLRVTAVEHSQWDFTASCDVTVTVDDVNDHRPRFVFPSPDGADVVLVDVEAGRPIRQLVCTLTAHDYDQNDNARLTFDLISDHSSDLVHFDLDPVTGQLRLIAEQLSVGYMLSACYKHK